MRTGIHKQSKKVYFNLLMIMIGGLLKQLCLNYVAVLFCYYINWNIIICILKILNNVIIILISTIFNTLPMRMMMRGKLFLFSSFYWILQIMLSLVRKTYKYILKFSSFYWMFQNMLSLAINCVWKEVWYVKQKPPREESQC